jgi:dsDNA-binding SOS-regulon protein
MTTLLEIESAAKQLPAKQKEALLLFLADALRSEREAMLPPPRKFTKEEIAAWIAEDENDLRRIRATP